MRILTAISMIFMAVYLSGCGSKTAEMIGGSGIQDFAKQQAVAETRCFAAWEKSFEVDCQGMDSRDCGYVKMQAENRKMMMEVANNGVHPCFNPNNLWTFMGKEVEEQNATIRSLGGNVLDLGKWVVGGSVAKTAVKQIGNHTSQYVGGDGSPSASNSESTNTETATGGLGEGAEGGSTGGGGVTPVVDDTAVDDTVSSEPVTVTED